MKSNKLVTLALALIVLLAGVQPAASIKPAAEEPIEVSFWYPYGEGSWTGDFLAGKIAAFNEANPGVIVEGQSFQDYGTIIEGIQRAAIAKDLPSIVTIAYGYDDYIINSGIAVPMNSYLGDNGEAFLNDFFPALLEVSKVGDQVYGIPLALSVAEIFYHPDLLEQAGLDPENPPATWDELIAAAKQIKEKTGVFGLTFALDDPWIFEAAVRSSGAELINPDGTPNLNSPEAIKILTDCAGGTKDGSIMYNADFMQTLQTFGAKQVAMYGVSSYGTVYYHTNLPEVKAMPFPAAEGHSFKSPAGGNSLYLMGNSDAEREAAAEFIKFLTNPESIAEWAMNSGYLPTRASSLKELEEFTTGFENYQVAVSSISNVVAPTAWPSRSILKINEILLQAIEAGFLNLESPETALNNANTEIAALIK